MNRKEFLQIISADTVLITPYVFPENLHLQIEGICMELLLCESFYVIRYLASEKLFSLKGLWIIKQANE